MKDYDNSLIKRVYECRNCDYKSESLIAASKHVELHKTPGPSNKPAFFPQYGVVKVPVEKAPTSQDKWLSEFNSAPEFPFKFTSESTVVCQICEQEFSAKQKVHISAHIKRKKHQENISRKEEKKAMVESGTTDLARDLCKMAVSANLPWNIFNNPILREILEKHMGKKLPCADTIAGRVNELYKEVFEDIKKDLAGKPFWLATDETNGM